MPALQVAQLLAEDMTWSLLMEVVTVTPMSLHTMLLQVVVRLATVHSLPDKINLTQAMLKFSM